MTYGRQVAVRDVDLGLAAGQVTALMGRNGSGKSTLMWALQGIAQASARHGAGGWPGPGRARRRAARRRLVGLVPQTAADLLYLETVAEECSAADREAGAHDGTARALLDRLAPGRRPGGRTPATCPRGSGWPSSSRCMLTAQPSVVCSWTSPPAASTTPARRRWPRSSRTLKADGCAVLRRDP